MTFQIIISTIEKGLICEVHNLFLVIRCMFPQTIVGWIVVLIANAPLLYLRIIIHELGHYVFRKRFGVSTEKVTFGTSKLLIRVGIFQFYARPSGGYNLPYTFFSDISVRKKKWIYRAGMLANFLTMLFWLRNPFWVLLNLEAIWQDSRVRVDPESGYVSDGAWLAILNGNLRLPEDFAAQKSQ